jgi:GTP-binding protein YchF
MHHPKSDPTAIEFVDIAGLVQGASRGEAWQQIPLAHPRGGAVVHVVRCFEDENIVHVDGSVDPVRDMETINLELVFADMETVEKRLDRTGKQAKSGDKALQAEVEMFEHAYKHLESGKPARTLPPEEAELCRQNFLLTAKPVIYVANIREDEIGRDDLPGVAKLYEEAAKEGAEALTVCARVEEELASLEPAEKQAFLEELGIGESGLDKLVKACYKLLGLISFLTAGPKEVRAWTIPRGTKAPQAAGKIHYGFQARVYPRGNVAYDTLMEQGQHALLQGKGPHTVRRQGLRHAGRRYHAVPV